MQWTLKFTNGKTLTVCGSHIGLARNYAKEYAEMYRLTVESVSPEKAVR